MSRRGMVSVKTKQIPRIFQRQKTSKPLSSLTSFNSLEDGISTPEQTENSHSDLFPGSSYDYQHVEEEKVKKGKKSAPYKSTTKEFPEKTWNASCQVIRFVFCFVFNFSC